MRIVFIAARNIAVPILNPFLSQAELRGGRYSITRAARQYRSAIDSMARGHFPRPRREVIFQKLVQLISASGTAMAQRQLGLLIEQYKWRERETH